MAHDDSDSGESTKSTMSSKTADNESKPSCTSCEKTIDDKQIVKCTRCKSIYHSRCAKKTEVLADGSLSKCCSSVTRGEFKSFLSALVKDLKTDLVSEINASVGKIMVRLDEQDTKIAATDNRVKKLETSSKQTWGSADKEDFFYELEDRRSRERNIIVYDFNNESETESDLDSLNAIFSKIKNFPSATSAHRFGTARDDGVEPLKVTFSSDSDALFVLRNKSKLSKLKLLIKNDLTPTQLNYFKELNIELDKRVEEGEKNLRIRYVEGIPTIIDTKKVNAKKNA